MVKSMKMRTTQPSNNPYYIRKVSGGYNGAVKGCPTIKGADVLCNCVGYANGRFAEIQDLGYIKYQLVCNAENFIERAKSMGLEISAVPVLGGIMVWQRGASLSDRDGAGHVAVVEKVINAGQIITSESGWNAWAFKTVTRSNSNGRWGQSSAYKFRGCIVNPAIGRKGAEDIKSITVDGEWGVMTTLFSQQIMKTFQDGFVSGQLTSCKKYLPNALSSSWEFSKNGKGSELIKAIQRLVGAKVDGFAGQNTVKALQRFLKAQSYYSGKIDGIMGANTVKGWQKWLNKPTYNPVPEEKPEEQKSKIGACANEYAYATNDSRAKYPSGSPKKVYKDALDKVYPNHNKWGTAPSKGASCDVFVGTCVRSAGIDKSFPRGLKEQITHLAKSDKFKEVSVTTSTVHDGDIIIYAKSSGGGHICIAYGGKIKEASYQKSYPKTTNTLKSRLSKSGKKWLKVYRAV